MYANSNGAQMHIMCGANVIICAAAAEQSQLTCKVNFAQNQHRYATSIQVYDTRTHQVAVMLWFRRHTRQTHTNTHKNTTDGSDSCCYRIAPHLNFVS